MMITVSEFGVSMQNIGSRALLLAHHSTHFLTQHVVVVGFLTHGPQ